MASIRELIKNPEPPKEEVVEHDGNEYRLKAGSALNAMGRTIFLTPNDLTVKAKHWQAVLKMDEAVDEKMVRQVLMVAETLQSDEGDEPYNELEIVQLAQAQPALFLSLIPAAYRVFGISEDPAESEYASEGPTAVERAAAGNSPKRARAQKSS